MKKNCCALLKIISPNFNIPRSGQRFKNSGYLAVLLMVLWGVSCVLYTRESYQESVSAKSGYWYNYIISANKSHRVYDEPSKRELNQIYYTVKNFDGERIRLDVPQTPLQYSKVCESNSKPHFACLSEIMLWGVLLQEISDEKSQLKDFRMLASNNPHISSQAFLEYALKGLVNRLDQYQAGSDKWVEEYFEQSALFNKTHFREYTDSFSETVKTIYTDYAINAWRYLPKKTDSNWLFYENVQLAEVLKNGLYYVNPREKKFGTLEHIQSAINFYLTAFQFHKLPGPPPKIGQAGYIKATIGEELISLGTGYTLQPTREGLWPVKELAIYDLYRLEILTRVLHKKGVLSEEQEKQKLETYKKLLIEIEIEDRTYWIKLSGLDQDNFSLAKKLAERASYRFNLGKINETENDLKEALNIYYKIGATREWATTSIKLATLYFTQKKYNSALATIDPAISSIESSLGFGSLEKFKKTLTIKEISLRKLNRESQLKQFVQLYKDKIDKIATTANKLIVEMVAIEAIPSLAIKEQRLRELLTTYQTDPLWNLVISIKILETLKAQGRLEETTKLAQQLRPKTKKINGTINELDIWGLLLDIQYDRGEYAGFLSALSEYEKLAKKLHGANWMNSFESMLARVYYSLEEYQKANFALDQKEKRRKRELIQYPKNSEFGRDLRDQLLSARIQFALGNKKQSMQIIDKVARTGKFWASDKAVALVKYKEIGVDVLQELGEMYLALGQIDKALEYLDVITDIKEPENELNTWES